MHAVQATGALDADTEAALYSRLAGRVGAYVSVGELRTTLYDVPSLAM